jgi:hypothetical protein
VAEEACHLGMCPGCCFSWYFKSWRGRGRPIGEPLREVLQGLLSAFHGAESFDALEFGHRWKHRGHRHLGFSARIGVAAAGPLHASPGLGVEHVLAEREQSCCACIAQVTVAIVTARRQAQQVLVAAQRRVVIV